MAGGPEDPDRNKTDPLGATQAPSGRAAAESAESLEPGETARDSHASRKRRPVHVGDSLGRYELVEDVGEGGMATVYRAKDKELRREVAVKVLFPHLARRIEVVRRFQREARAAASLDHPNILRIFDVGEVGVDDESPPFIVMELVRGTSLLTEIEVRGPMFAEVVACVGALLADALTAAHAAGIIHRDIKPANVLVAQGGRVLLADFGVARLETEDSLVTKTGALLGTPAYMSPEQAAGDTATAKSDLYSLGATLYQLSTGALPYTGSPAKVLAQIAQGSRVAAVKKRAEVGPDLSRVIDRLMAVEADDRPASAKDIAAELRAIAIAGGLGDAAEEVKAYFADQAEFVRAKTPTVVTAIVTAANRAVADEKLPRAMALADRASALAPDDPSVAALITSVTEGGRAKYRRRVMLMGALGVVVAGGAAATGVAIVRHHGAAASDDAAVIAMVGDALPSQDADLRPVLEDAAGQGDAAPPDAARPRADAGVVRDARMRDAADVMVMTVIPDAFVPPDAAVPVDVLPLADGAIAVVNDTWCDVTIDRALVGRPNKGPFRVHAGKHTVLCEQTGTVRKWSREIDVPAGRTVTVSGVMLGDVDIRFETAATLDGTSFGPGDGTKKKAGYHQLEAGGQKKHLDLRTNCVVRNVPDLDCYPANP